MKNCTGCEVYEKCIASVLSKEECNEFESHLTTKIEKPKKVIYKEQHSANNVYVLVEGDIKLELKDAHMQPTILRIAHSGEMLGIESIFSNYNYFMTATTLSDSKICIIPKSYVSKIINKNHKVCYKLITEMQNVQERIYQHSLLMISGTSESKLAQALLLLVSKNEEVKITKEKIALMTGLTRETVSRILSRMNSKKIIETLPRSVIILNKKELHKISISTKDQKKITKKISNSKG